jgi:hypothetical protein
LGSEPQHTSQHKHYIYALTEFLATQSKITQRFIPHLNESFHEIERRLKMLSQRLDAESQDIDKDFA